MRKLNFSLLFIATTSILASGSALAGPHIINIATPDGKGVSVNNYNQFNVSKDGTILNNSARSSNTQLGGNIQGNNNLSNGSSARLIINQVAPGGSRSLLAGQIEVAGQKADVIVSNPNGITCSGCGFINTSSAQLTTQQVVVNNQYSGAAKMASGDVRFEGKGLVSPELGSLKINGGRITVDAPVSARNVAMQANTGIDVSALGAVNANAIYLLNSTGKVFNQGKLTANRGITIKNDDGNILNTGKIKAKDVTLQGTIGTMVMNAGEIKATNNLAIDNVLLTFNGFGAALKGDNNTKINSMSVQNNGEIASSLGNVDFDAGSVSNMGNIEAGSAVTLAGRYFTDASFENVGGVVRAESINVGGENVTNSADAQRRFGGTFDFATPMSHDEASAWLDDFLKKYGK